MSAAPLLVELGCEELPAGACRTAERAAGRLVEEFLVERRLAPGAVHVYVTPRRIAVLAEDVPAEQPAQTLLHKGPPERAARTDDGSWSDAARGFARKHGLVPEDLAVEDGLLAARVEASAEPLDRHVQDLVDTLIDGLQMPKNMRWGSGQLRFSRPIRTLAVLHGERVLTAEVQGVAAGRLVRGHRVRRPWFDLERADEYAAELGGAGVAAATADRRELIETLLTARAGAVDATWEDPAGVLAEVVYLVEWPDVLIGDIAERHLALPEIVLITAMQSHQRYLPLRRSDGSLAPHFATVVNSDPSAAETVRAGNERVLAGRLDDAAFSLEKDRARGLESMAAELERITYHQRLGTLAARVERLRAIVDDLADRADASAEVREQAATAARLAKADLASTLVAEFAELQGHVGRDYARAAGLPEGVAQALREQYMPEGAGRPLPETLPGALLALADRIDQLVGVVAVGERPTGSRDPYALRRAASGLVEIQSRYAIPLDLDAIVDRAYGLLVEQGADLELSVDAVREIVVPFILDRVDQSLGEDGVPVDVQRAARGADLVDPLRLAALARVLHAAADDDELAATHAAVVRLSRIADADAAAAAVDPAAFATAEEAALLIAIDRLAPAIASSAPEDALRAGAELAPAVDALFEAVMIVDDDPAVRANRLALVEAARAAYAPLGDLTRLQR